ncbi:hypothetical protein F5Y16DRAFT_155276 [Xylariaceae sp. FL0255]|nr:hypothetical protein F5Y16DRAFT_155276 [Xylariaceae sp. FL0255]
MDPLSLTASVIAVATLTLQSVKTTYDVVDKLVDAPLVIARSKTSLLETQKTLGALRQLLMTGSDPPTVMGPILQTIGLEGTLKSAQGLCDNFTTTIARFTTHSAAGPLSKRDRFAVMLHDSNIVRFNEGLSGCQRALSVVLLAIDLIISARTADEIGRLNDRFHNLERTLADLITDLSQRTASPAVEADGAADESGSIQLRATLKKVCREALPATQAKRVGQTFGNMSTDTQSFAMQGIAGDAYVSAEQKFGTMTTVKGSRAFQGQMDAASFAVMFGR